MHQHAVPGAVPSWCCASESERRASLSVTGRRSRESLSAARRGEAKGESSAQLIDHLKKADMAKEAERLLDGSGWLPEPLRSVDSSTSSVEQEGETGPLPEFLADEEDRENADDDDPQQLDAAE
ncbi:hypothetical protein ACM41_22170 [Bradyrhizobium sp. CCBAU 21362]|nr:hypothetical protein [Bradyrhizobium sp. CCBAU 21362]